MILAFLLTIAAGCTFAASMIAVLIAATSPTIDAIALAIGVFFFCLTAYLARKADSALEN